MEELLTGLLASVAGGQRYWLRAPQKVKRPYVLLQLVGDDANYHMRGASGFSSSRVQIDVYADTKAEETVISRSIKGLLSGYSAGQIQGIFIESERNLPAADAGEVNNVFRNSIDITIHHGELP